MTALTGAPAGTGAGAPRARVAVLGGGRNAEHGVSLASAAFVAQTLAGAGHEVLALTIGPDGCWERCGERLGTTPAASIAVALGLMAGCDVVLPLVHGRGGEDGALAALCDLAGLPRAGSGLRAGALGMDKWATKLVAGSLGIATADGALVTAADLDDSGHLDWPWTSPVVVKPVSAGSSHGVTLVERPDELAAAVRSALALDDRVLVEQLVIGREVDVAVLELRDGTRVVSPALEVVVGDGELFDTDRKSDGTAEFRVPAALEAGTAAALATASLALFEALGCAGVARFDFFVTDAGIVLNEVNTTPGMTASSQVPRMFAAAGIAPGDLLAELVAGALAAPTLTASAPIHLVGGP